MPMREYSLSQSTLLEMQFTSKVIEEIIGIPLECEGVLVKQHNGVLKNIFPYQDIDTASCTSYHFSNIFQHAYAHNNFILGVWHSHGQFPVFHSKEDDKHLEQTILPLYYHYEEQYVQPPQLSLEEDQCILTLQGRTYIMHPQNQNTSKTLFEHVASITEKRKQEILSIVINKKNDLYAKAFLKHKSHEVPLMIIKDKKQINKVEILKNMGDKISYQGKKLSQFTHYQEFLKKYQQERNTIFLKKRLERLKRPKSFRKRFLNLNVDQDLFSLVTILGGSYPWFVREKQFMEHYPLLRQKEEIHKDIKKIVFQLQTHHYLTKKHPKIYQTLTGKLKELRYRSVFKKIRRKRYQSNVKER